MIVKKIFIKLFAASLLAGIGTFCGLANEPQNAYASTTIDPPTVEDDGEAVFLYGRKIGYYDEQGQTIFVPQESPHYNATAFQCLLGLNDKSRTLVIPKGETIHLATDIIIKSNKTILAKGATIIEDTTGQLLTNECKGKEYNCLKNVVIDGGVWKNQSEDVTQSVLLFLHANHVVVKNTEIYTNYQGHGFSFVACADCKLLNSKILAVNNATKAYECKEEAVQLDIATAASAPRAARQGKKYAKGQCCKNIVIKGCKIRGSRGVSTCWTKKDPQYAANLHKNIRIENCDIEGISGEPVTIYNCKGFQLKKNTLYVNKNPYLNTKDFYSNGLSINILGKTNALKNTKSYITGNTIKGYYHGIFLWSTNGANHGIIYVKGNKLYASQKSDALFMSKYCSLKLGKNDSYKR